MHFFFFVLFILLCSFYLINLILAIVAMAYNEQQERDRSELEAEANEKQVHSPKSRIDIVLLHEC